MAPAALTVGQKAALIAAIAIAILAAAVLATAWLTSVRIALVLWSGALLLLVAVAWLRPLHADRLAAAPDPAPELRRRGRALRGRRRGARRSR